jgi:tRNA (guanine-N7-)-methyltransferase
LFFDSYKPLHIEIGMGKGDFLMALAANCPDTEFIGVEKALTIMHIAAEKNQADPLPNLHFLPVDAKKLVVYFGLGQVERIYLNFSDPWPKKRHIARRLTAKHMLEVYRRLLKPGGQIHLKTDQESFFVFSLRELVREGWSVGKITSDLYRSGFEGNVVTEYEQRFTSLGQPIYRLEAWSAQLSGES